LCLGGTGTATYTACNVFGNCIFSASRTRYSAWTEFLGGFDRNDAIVLTDRNVSVWQKACETQIKITLIVRKRRKKPRSQISRGGRGGGSDRRVILINDMGGA
jgi:hypothetical protein